MDTGHVYTTRRVSRVSQLYTASICMHNLSGVAAYTSSLYVNYVIQNCTLMTDVAF